MSVGSKARLGIHDIRIGSEICATQSLPVPFRVNKSIFQILGALSLEITAAVNLECPSSLLILHILTGVCLLQCDQEQPCCINTSEAYLVCDHSFAISSIPHADSTIIVA